LLTDRYLVYSLADPDAKSRLVQAILATLRSDRPTDSPIFSMLPELPEADPSHVQALPQDFREEVGRARAARSRGWLRLLADDVRGRRFERPGLQLVAHGQWDLKDYSGARKTLERIRAIQRDNVAANLALANVYERLYRDDPKPELLAASDQAIERVLASREVLRGDRVEALALQGRNQKTGGGRNFRRALEQRRAAGMSESCARCFAATGPPSPRISTTSGPGSPRQMARSSSICRGERRLEVDVRRGCRRTGIARRWSGRRGAAPSSPPPWTALARMPASDPDRIWAEVSMVDVLFLTEQNDQRVVNRYRDTIPLDKPFGWDAARGQLQLFADLGVRAGRAEKVIQEVDRKFAGTAPPARMPVHVVVFAGHRIDAPGRPEPRFPAGQVDRARGLIRDALTKLVSPGSEMLGFASAAPGGDLLFHEACDALGIRSIPCLPMPADEYSRQTFQNLDEWRSRFLALRERNRERRWGELELSDQAGLPRWLQAPRSTPGSAEIGGCSRWRSPRGPGRSRSWPCGMASPREIGWGGRRRWSSWPATPGSSTSR
jgi:hypothetical protein